MNSWVTTSSDQSQDKQNVVDDEIIEKTRVGRSRQKYNTGNGSICCHGYCGKKCLLTVLFTQGMYMRYPPIAFACLLELLEAGREG